MERMTTRIFWLASTLFTFSYFHFRYSASPLKIFVAGQPTMYDSELEQLCHDQIQITAKAVQKVITAKAEQKVIRKKLADEKRLHQRAERILKEAVP